MVVHDSVLARRAVHHHRFVRRSLSRGFCDDAPWITERCAIETRGLTAGFSLLGTWSRIASVMHEYVATS